jgi:hypothetical protein
MARPIDPAREQARARGEKRYIAARACPLGHVGERFVISTACCICADIKRVERIGNRKPIKVKVPKPIKIAEPVKVIAPSTPIIVRALADYYRTVEARERSRHLDHLIRK